jgi:hypothetical protein
MKIQKDHARVDHNFELVKSIGALLRSLSRPSFPARGIKNSHTNWLDGAKPPLKYVFLKIRVRETQRIDQLQPYVQTTCCSIEMY